MDQGKWRTGRCGNQLLDVGKDLFGRYPQWPVVRSLIVRGSAVFAGTRNGIYRSENDGDTWSPSNLDTGAVTAFADHGGALFAAGDSGVFRSTDNGESWPR
jgi:hypothetical protein